MEYKLFIYLAILLAVVLLGAHIADMRNLKKFRETMIPGTKALFKLDGNWCIVEVRKIRYNGSLEESECTIAILINETPYLIDVDITDLYLPNKYNL